MSICRECWDPIDDPHAKLCDWCSLTPQQRRARMRRGWLWLIALAAACAVALLVLA